MSGTVVLLLDEIHRLDKTKQDFLLPLLENGAIILIGATTENPYININPAIRSRTQIFEVHPLSPDDIEQALHRALHDTKKKDWETIRSKLIPPQLSSWQLLPTVISEVH